MMTRRSLLLATTIAIAALPDPGRSQSRALCDQQFDGDIAGLYARIKAMPGAAAMQSANPAFDVLSVGPRGDIWNFTKVGHPAHPSVACRRLVQVGDAWKVRTDIQCRATKSQCDKLAADYQALDKEMSEAIRRRYPKK